MHEVLAVLPARKGASAKALAEAKARFLKPERFYGILKTYRPDADTGDPLPPENVPLADAVSAILAGLVEPLSKHWDAAYQVDLGNAEATADVALDTFEMKDVPATQLLQLDKRLGELADTLQAIPVLDLRKEWEAAPEIRLDVSKAKPEVGYRTEKVLESRVLYEATPEHPAQVKEWSVDRKVGEFTTQRWSGAVSLATKNAILTRLTGLKDAVRAALSKANTLEHPTKRLGEHVLAYIFGDAGKAADMTE